VSRLLERLADILLEQLHPAGKTTLAG